jgi:hypothetical protein
LAFFAGKVKQDHRYARIDTVRGDLRTHHARAEYSDFFYDEIRHEIKLPTMDIFDSSWIPAYAGMTLKNFTALQWS